MSEESLQDTTYDVSLAVIGMAGQFPDAPDINAFWNLLVNGKKATRHFSDEALLQAGVMPEILRNPNYVKAGMVLDGIELFDASFFGFNPREAEVMDPQSRLFLQNAWHALEDAGHIPGRSNSVIGIFAGKHPSSYHGLNLYANPQIVELVGMLQIASGNDADALATMVSYKLDLKGPSLTVQTFCSTSMVAIHLACQSLLAYECDMALAGGAAIQLPHRTGYLYEEGSILSPDGECRSFDAAASGSIYGSGVGVVALKRLTDALADGDHIYAIIRGSTTNNDGITRVGYTAPGLNGQATVILEALENADVHPESISYIETHGTGTPLGDSVELAAMTRAFRMQTDKCGFCAIGSVKPNIGHLDRASGVTSLIKASLALHHKLLPPSLNFEKPLPDFDLDNSPFFVNAKLRKWASPNGDPLRAGVSSFGLGGTNVHVVLEEAPPPLPATASRPCQLLLLSAKTAAALEITSSNLIDYLQAGSIHLPDVAYTLQVGRAVFNHRRMVVCTDAEDAATALSMADPRRVFTIKQTYQERPVVFMFPGVGDHYPGMGQELYQTEPTFRHWVDEGARLLQPYLSTDLRQLLYPNHTESIRNPSPQPLDLRRMLASTDEVAAQTGPLRQTVLAQPAVFVVEYALAQLLMEWGLKPQALIGYSLGEYTAACLSGVLSFPDAIKLVAERARLIDSTDPGAMLTVALSEKEIQPYLNENICLAGVLTSSISVLSGPLPLIVELKQLLDQRDIACRRLPTTQAFHSSMMETVASDLEALAQTVTLHAPQIPYLSNLTGTWIRESEATDPAYWVRHMCQPVRFADSLVELLKDKDRLLLEVGPGQSLGAFVRQHSACEMAQAAMILPTLPYHYDEQSSSAFLLTTLGKAWLAGATIDWEGFYAHEFRHRLSLPTYPFERQRYWLEPNTSTLPVPAALPEGKKADIGEWFYQSTWKQREINGEMGKDVLPDGALWLLFEDAAGLGNLLAEKLVAAGQSVARVRAGSQFRAVASDLFTINPQEPRHYRDLLRTLPGTPTQVVHLWGIEDLSGIMDTGVRFAQAQETGFYSLLNLVKAIERQPDSLHIWVVTSQAQAVTGIEQLEPAKGTIAGICRVIAQENLSIFTHTIDIIHPLDGVLPQARLTDRLMAEFTHGPNELAVAYRGNKRWVQVFEPIYLDKPQSRPTWRQQGVYLIVGGLGAVGMTIGQHLAQTWQAKLILTTRSPYPARHEWDNWLKTHDEMDRTSQQIRQFMTWESLGAEVWVAQADAGDATQVLHLLTQVDARYEKLHGVLYAAGISGDAFFTSVHEITRAACEAHFRSKAHGLYVLETALADRTLDFCLLFSSISSVLGGLGFAGYAAANNFIDLFTHQHNRHHSQWWTAVNWDTWRTRADLHDGMGATVAIYDMPPAAALEALERIIASQFLTQIVNSTGSLETRIDQWVRMLSIHQAAAESNETIVAHPRPELMTAYAPPTNETERLIVEIWQPLLGIEPIGIHDNFLELGGHSLLAIQVISRLRQTFQVHIPLALILSSPTVSNLAVAVELAIIEELENMPDDAAT
ncbi:MAG: acyltransferase domain-containing protein [Ardenticatenales bacterium]|nr:acyltransferase domain-containing protein [Ardenticatenales bacterium]